MTTVAESSARVWLEFSDGSTIDTWESVELHDAFTDPLGDFKFTLRPTTRSALAHATAVTERGELVKVYIGNARQATMTIVTRSRRIDRGGTVISIGCKTPLCVPYVAHVDPTLAAHFTSATTVSELVLRVLAPYGFDMLTTTAAQNVNVLTGKSLTRGADAIVTELKLKEVEAHEGETAYGFCSRIFQRLGLTLRCRWDGQLLLVAPNYDQSVAYSLVQERTHEHAGDIMLDGIELAEDNGPLFSEVTIRGESPDGAGAKTAGRPVARCLYASSFTPDDAPFKDAPKVELPTGKHVYRSTSQRWKPAVVTDKLSRDLALATSRAKRFMGRSSENAYVLTCEVRGLVSTTGRVWTVDTLARVVAKDLGIDEPMWILETTKKSSRSAGGAAQQSTTLKLIPKGALVLGDVPGAA